MRRQFSGMPQQFREVVERIGSIQLTGMDQTHEQIAGMRSVQCLVEKRIPPIQDRLLQRALDDVMPTPGLCRAEAIFLAFGCIPKLADAA